MCDFGISETIAGVTAGVAASSATAATTTATAAAIPTSIAAAAAGQLALAPALTTGLTATLGSSIGAGSTIGSAAAGITGGVTGAAAMTIGEAAAALGVGSIAEAAAGAGAAGLGVTEYGSLASLILSLGAGGASAGVNAKQAKAQGAAVKQQAKNDRQNAVAQANTESMGSAQSSFELAVQGIAGRGQAYSSGLSEKSVRAIGRAVGFQTGTDRATVAKNQDIANQVATARLRGINLTESSQKLQVGDPGAVAGIGAIGALAQGLRTGAGAYRAFSNFRIPTDEPNLAFV